MVPLIELVADSENNQELRHEAVETLVNIGDNRALPALINALADEDSLIRSDSAWALGEFRSVQAVEPLLLALRDEDIDVRYEAAKSLGQIGDKRAVEPLIKALEDETEVRQAAAEALGKLGDSRAIPALLLSEQRETARLHKNRDAKESAAQAIKEILSRKQDTDSALVPWQLSLTTDDVKYGLAVAPFIDALNDNDPTTRRSAASALGQLRDWRAIEPLLDALKSDDPDLRYNAAEALGNLGDERAVFALAWIKDNDLALTLSGKRVRDAATQALETINAAKDFNDPTE